MKKLGIILDSFAGLSKQEVESMGFGYLPFFVMIDNKTYLDGVHMSFSESAQKIKVAKVCKTSQPNLEMIEKVFQQMLTKYQKIVYLSINSNISSTFASASKLAQKFQNKIEVWDNAFIGLIFVKVAKWLQEQYELKQIPLTKLKQKVNSFNKKIRCFIVPKDIQAFKIGGRLKKGVSFLLSKLKIVPLIEYQTFGIGIVGVRRGFGKSVVVAIDRLKKHMQKTKINYKTLLIYSADPKTLAIAKEKLAIAKITNYQITSISTSIFIQAGYGAISIVIYPQEIK